MIETTDADTAPNAKWLTWLSGGVLISAAGLLGLIGLAGTGFANLFILVAAVIFAVGFSRDASLTARRPVGTGALLLFGVLIATGPPMLGPRLEEYMFSTYGLAFGLGSSHPAADPVVIAFAGATAVLVLLGLCAAIVAGVSVIRAGTVDRALSWLPLVLMTVAVLVVFAVVVLRGWDAAILDPMHTDSSGPLERMQGPATLILGMVIIVLALIERSRTLDVAATNSHRSEERKAVRGA